MIARIKGDILRITEKGYLFFDGVNTFWVKRKGNGKLNEKNGVELEVNVMLINNNNKPFLLVKER